MTYMCIRELELIFIEENVNPCERNEERHSGRRCYGPEGAHVSYSCPRARREGLWDSGGTSDLILNLGSKQKSIKFKRKITFFQGKVQPCC